MGKCEVVNFEGINYKLKKNAAPAPKQGDRLAYLIWLNQNTYPKGYQKQSIKLPELSVNGV